MQVQPLRQPNPNPISFGIYKGHKITPYGKCTYGEYKKYNIEIYDDVKSHAKIHYVSHNSTKRCVAYKFAFLKDGVKRILRGSMYS